jgi:Flp pilus assembly protein TadD
LPREGSEAKKEFEAALAVAPDYAEPLAQLVNMALKDKQPDAALALVTKQVSLAPKSGSLQNLLGLVYLERREPAQAEGAFLKAIELDPQLGRGLSSVWPASMEPRSATTKR